MDDLNDLLAESLKIQADAKAVKEAQKRMKQTGGVTSAERKEDAERIARWEAAHVWKPEANVARFVEQECQHCGDCQYLFSGLLERQSSRVAGRMDKAQRWVAVPLANPALPKETMMARQPVDFCMECMEEHGFDLDSARWEDGEQVQWAEPEPDEGPVTITSVVDIMPLPASLLTLAGNGPLPAWTNPTERSEEAHAI